MLIASASSARHRAAAYVRAARPLAHGMIALPLLLGQALALLAGAPMSWSALFLAQAFGLFCQAYILYLNDIADAHVDSLGPGTWLSGGSRVLQDAALDSRQLQRAAFAALALMLGVAALGMLIDRPWMLCLGSIAALAGWTYSLEPLKASYAGFGELHQALSCAVLLPLMGFYLQGGSFAVPVMPLLAVAGLFYVVGIITALPDTEADRDAGKKTFAVRHGLKRARQISALLSVACALAIPLALSEWIHLLAGVLVITLPALLFSAPALRESLAGSSSRMGPARFATLLTLGQGWTMLSTTILLFWQVLVEKGVLGSA